MIIKTTSSFISSRSYFAVPARGCPVARQQYHAIAEFISLPISSQWSSRYTYLLEKDACLTISSTTVGIRPVGSLRRTLLKPRCSSELSATTMTVSVLMSRHNCHIQP